MRCVTDRILLHVPGGGDAGAGGALIGKNSMTPKQQRFVQEYLLDLCATKAAIRAGYSRRSARAIGHENLTKPDIARAIHEAIAARGERTEISADQVVRELAAIAFADVRTLLDSDGRFRAIRDLDSMTATPLAAIEIREIADEPGRLLKVRLWNKLKALELLGRHFGVFSERDRLEGAAGPLVVEIVRFGTE
jgi:phage terminase small subunit